MSPATQDRLFGYTHAFDHPVTAWITGGIAAAILLAALVLFVLARAGRLDPRSRDELRKRTLTWAVLFPLMVGPVLLGALWTIAAVGLLSLLCYREYARATGLFRERAVSAAVVLGILAVTFAAADHWYGLFVALVPLTVAAIAGVAVFADRPKGYIQRVALGVLGFGLFGSALGHLGYFANDANYRPILLWLLVTVELNDVFAYLTGKAFGRRKLAPETSPNKTIGGAAGAFVLTTALVAGLGHFVFRGTALDHPVHLAALGAMVSVLGQLGDLVLSSIKRDIGVKDMDVILPGHGGLLDRFDSLLLAVPAVFHYVGYHLGIGLDQQTRIWTGGG
jgi:phosphatidate cytidylyltransferase